MKRRSLSVLLAGLLAVSPVCQNAYGAENVEDVAVVNYEDTSDYVYYIDENNIVGISGYNGSETDIVIPAEIDGMPIAYVSGFENNTRLKSVTLSEGIKGIAYEAFSGCKNLEKITLPSSIRYINPYAFQECENLEMINFPVGLERIHDNVFWGCKKLKSILIPETVTSIDTGAFDYSGLNEIKVDSANTVYCDMDGVLFSKDKKILIVYPNGRSDSSYTIPDFVTQIGDSAFYSCENLETIDIPNTVTMIDSWAFTACSSLKNVTLSKNTAVLGMGTFYKCEKLESVLFLCGDTDFIGSGLNRDVVIYAPRGGLTEEIANAGGREFHDTSEYLAQPILSELSTTDSTIILTWEPVNRAQGYYVYRKSEGSDWEQIGAVSEPDITSYTDETAVAGTNYTYTACAYTVAGNFLGPRDETGKTARIPAALKLEAQTGGINVTTTDEILAPDTRLVTDRVSTSVKDLINADFVGIADYDWRSAVLYDIYLEKDSQKVQPNGEVTVSIPVPDQMDGEQCSVLYIDDTGNVVDMKAVYLDGYMVFTTNHFSHYALVEAATGIEVSGTITSYGTEDGAVTVSLLDGDTEVESVENTDSTYTFASVPFGTYTLQVSKENHVTRTYDITVSDEPVTQDVKICLMGDVTGDGKVNTRDLNRLYAHVNGTNLLTGYEFACGDVTGDGKINTRDLNRLYAHISETNPLW